MSDVPSGPPRTADRHLVAFAGALRRAGVDVPVDCTLEFGRAVAEVGADTAEGVYWSGRATLVKRPEEIPLYDEVFSSHWLGGAPRSGQVVELPALTLVLDDGPATTQNDVAEESLAADTFTVLYSRAEVLGAKDFAECTEEELAELRDLMDRFRFVRATRRCRRLRPAAGRGRPDLRRTVRAAMGTGGEPLRWFSLEPGERPRRLVLLLDVSGSMEAYARVLIRFVHAASVGRSNVEVFALGTRLTRLTRELATRDPDAALTRVTGAVADWSGGTRLGDGLAEFNDQWGVRGMARGARVVILSDGWDRGDPSVMDEQMLRLGRVAHEVVWVNPLKATPGYAPLAQGMAAALPHVDQFVAGNSLDSLRVLAELLAD